MSPSQSKQHFLIDSMNGSVEKAVNEAVGGLTSELHKRMRLWERQMETQLKRQIQQHCDIFEKKWMEKIVEPDSRLRLFWPSIVFGKVCNTRLRNCGRIA